MLFGCRLVLGFPCDAAGLTDTHVFRSGRCCPRPCPRPAVCSAASTRRFQARSTPAPRPGLSPPPPSSSATGASRSPRRPVSPGSTILAPPRAGRDMLCRRQLRTARRKTRFRPMSWSWRPGPGATRSAKGSASACRSCRSGGRSGVRKYATCKHAPKHPNTQTPKHVGF